MKKYEFIKDTDENGNKTISVSDKPKRKLDLFPRFLCLLISLVVWLWMVNFNDTDVLETMVLKIEVEGQDVLEDREMMIYAIDKREITVTVKGSNRDLRKYSADDYRAVVDVSKIDEAGQHTLPLYVIPPQGSSLTVSESEPLNVSLKTDFVARKNVSFDVFVTNVQDGGLVKYSFENRLADDGNKVVDIVGPASYVDLISSARLTVDGSFAPNADEKVFSDFPLTFLDKNLNSITLEHSVIEYSTENINVHVMAIAHKEIPVRVNVVGEGAGLVATPSIKAVEVWGPPSLIKNVSEYVIKLDKAELGKDDSHLTSSEFVADGIFVTEGVQITISFTEKVE